MYSGELFQVVVSHFVQTACLGQVSNRFKGRKTDRPGRLGQCFLLCIYEPKAEAHHFINDYFIFWKGLWVNG